MFIVKCLECQIILKPAGVIQKSLNTTAKIGEGHVYMGVTLLTLDLVNYIIKELSFSNLINHQSVEGLTTEWMISSEANSPQSEGSTDG